MAEPHASAALLTPPWVDRLQWLLVVWLLGLHALLALTAAAEKSPTFDEPVHLLTGYVLWQTGDYRINTEGGLLSQCWAALPLLVTQPEMPNLSGQAWRESAQWTLAGEFLFHANENPQAIIMQGRTMMMLLSIALGLMVYLWARRLFGIASGLVALTLFALSPTLLAHGSLVTADVPAALFFLLAMSLLWRVMHQLTPANLLMLTAALVGLCLTKGSWVLILPMAGVLALIRIAAGKPLVVVASSIRKTTATRIQRRARIAGMLAAAALIVSVMTYLGVWVGYSFRYAPEAAGTQPPAQYALPWEQIKLASPSQQALIHASRQWRLLPEAMIHGQNTILFNSAERGSYLLGEIQKPGSPWYFAVTLLVKSSLALLVLLPVGLITLARTRRPLGALAYRMTPLLVLLAVYGVFACITGLKVGHRHLLPVLPVLFILAGASGRGMGKPARSQGHAPLTLVRWALVLVMLGSLTWTSLTHWPHYIAFFNPIAGGPAQGRHILVDSNLDWGQDLPALSQWLESHNDLGLPVHLLYSGTSHPGSYDIRARLLAPPFGHAWPADPDAPLDPGIYAVSANYLHGYQLASHPWTAALESRYQAIRATHQNFAAANSTRRAQLLAAYGSYLPRRLARSYATARFLRLCAWLRTQPPDGHVGHSIYIYHLTTADLEAALDGPVPFSDP